MLVLTYRVLSFLPRGLGIGVCSSRRRVDKESFGTPSGMKDKTLYVSWLDKGIDK